MTKSLAPRVSKNTQTNERRTLDAAVIIINPEWDSLEQRPSGFRFGATNGGVEFTSESTFRVREYDGTTNFPTKGDQILESSSTTATAQVAELTDAILQKVMKADIEELSDGRKKLRPRKTLTEHDYIDSVGLVGYTPENDWLMITLHNVLITSPITYATEDNGDMVLEVTFTAHTAPEDLADPEKADYLPYEIITAPAMEALVGEMQAVLPESETPEGGTEE